MPFNTEDPGSTAQVLYEVGLERGRQYKKWGPQHHPDGTSHAGYATMRDEARESCDDYAARGEVTWLDILLEETYEAAAERDEDRLREELVQVAAVAAAWIEDIDSRG